MNHSSGAQREIEFSHQDSQKIAWLATVARLWRQLSGLTEAAQIYEAATALLANAFEADLCAILRYDEARQELICQSPAHGLDPSIAQQMRFSVKEGHINRLIWERDDSLIVDDIALDPRFKPCRDLAQTLGIRSALTCRLGVGEERLGAILLARTVSEKSFGETDVALLRILAEQVASALGQAQTLKALTREARRGRTLHQMASLLHSTLDEREILEVAATMAILAIGADRGHLFLGEDPEAAPLWGLSMARGREGQQWEISETLEKERMRWFIEQWQSLGRDRPTIIEDIFLSPLIPSSWSARFGIKTLVLVPLQTSDRLCGYMMFEYREAVRQLTEDDITLISDIASQTALALSQAQVHRSTQREAQSLRASAALYVPLVMGSRAGLLVVQEGRYQFGGGLISGLLGYGPEELTHLYLLDLFASNSQPVMLESYERILAGEIVPSFDAQALRKDGGEIAVTVVGSLIEYGGRPAVEFVVSDTTEQRRELMRDLMESKLEAVTRLIGNLVGEARNALTPVLGFAELTLGQSGLSPEARGNIQTILQAAERVKKTFDNLATWAHLQSPKRTQTNINDLLRRIVALRQYEWQGYQIDVTVDLLEGLPEIQADPQQLQIAFLAMMDNAKDALKERSGDRELVIRTRRRQPDFWQTTEGIEISFQDNGAGIAPENLSRVFDPFFSTKPPTLALGLGLWICYRVIEQHGGQIAVHSQQGHGATFTLTLPIAAKPVATSEGAENDILWIE